MDGKCPNCGHELVLLEEWQEDVMMCPACRLSSATPNIRTRSQYRNFWQQMVAHDTWDQPCSRLQTPRKLLSQTSPRRKLLSRLWLWFVGLGMVVNLANCIRMIAEHARHDPVLVSALIYAFAILVATVMGLSFYCWRRARAAEAFGRVARAPFPIAAGDVTSLLMGLTVREDRANCIAGLIAVAPTITEVAASQFDMRTLRALASHAMPDFRKQADANWDLVIAACRILGKTRWGPALWPLGRLAAEGIEGWSVPEAVRAAAADAAHSVRERILTSAMGDTLLRAATPDDDTGNLLRPASQDDTPSEQLLRRGHDVTE